MSFEHFLEVCRQSPPRLEDEPARSIVATVEGLLEMKRDGLLLNVHIHESTVWIEMHNAPGVKRRVGFSWAADAVREYRDRKQKNGVNHGNAKRAAAELDTGPHQHDQKPKGTAAPAADRLPQRASTPSVARVGSTAEEKAAPTVPVRKPPQPARQQRSSGQRKGLKR